MRLTADLAQHCAQRINPLRERELAILRTGWLCRARYEWGQHVEVARRGGMSDTDIRLAQSGPGTPGIAHADRALLAATQRRLASRGLSLRQAFHAFNSSRTGNMTCSELYSALRWLDRAESRLPAHAEELQRMLGWRKAAAEMKRAEGDIASLRAQLGKRK